LGPLCWFTGIAWLRRLTFVAFILFHLYSVSSWILVYHPHVALALAAFLRFDRPLLAGYRFSRRHVPALVI